MAIVTMSLARTLFNILYPIIFFASWGLCAPNITCSPNPRTFFMTDKEYGDPNLDVEGKLFPKMADMMCDLRFCPPQGRPKCSLTVQPFIRNSIGFYWNRPDSMDTRCYQSAFQAIIERCLNANPPTLGGTNYLSERESYTIQIDGFSRVQRVGHRPKSQKPVPPPEEPATFYVGDWRDNFFTPATGLTVFGTSHGDCDWLVKSKGPNADPMDTSANSKLKDYMATIGDVVLGDGQQLPAFYYYHDQLPQFKSFTLQGTDLGICGLKGATFEFKKIQEGKFSFTDKGKGGPVIGYCNVITSDTEKNAQNCSGKDGDNLGEILSVQNVLACHATGIPNYCLDYGKTQ
ncbi:hypothetical protein BDV96DRAFT_683350 [Lophiotrema nucula]|uniref:Uncharacterized protein n=1 Tax=Lophiotrema nucula TaxID=690887 RepID=A0A6A5ZRR7_9PLEO|nr:hypothetical protein BDV96DRAFT_683350 [Lophiotrema nucula]